MFRFADQRAPSQYETKHALFSSYLHIQLQEQ